MGNGDARTSFAVGSHLHLSFELWPARRTSPLAGGHLDFERISTNLHESLIVSVVSPLYLHCISTNLYESPSVSRTYAPNKLNKPNELNELRPSAFGLRASFVI